MRARWDKGRVRIPKTKMAIQVSQSKLFLLVLVLVNLAHDGGATVSTIASLSRDSFPAGFIFGTASSAYQYEGAANEGGRKPSIWDTFTHEHPDKIMDQSNGDVAIDSYHRYKEDVSAMKEMGMDAYRFSISWSRILPDGTQSGGVNKEGIQYYNNLINELLANKIQPFVTLFHWDLPQALEDKYGGFLSPDIIYDFQDFADICFKEFGDRVKHWITLNEPVSFVTGYSEGTFAPGRCSSCSKGNSSTEPYLVGHHQLLAHAAAVSLYRDKYQASQNGKIGITLNSNWMVPYSDSHSDVDAVKRGLDFMYGWFLSPITHGNYPKSMRSRVKDRLPEFTKKEMRILKGSFDFLGVNYYTSNYAADDKHCKDANSTYATDSCAKLSQEIDGVSIGPTTGSPWLRVYPQGIWDLLIYTKEYYNSPEIYITENGVSDSNNGTMTMEEALADKWRIDYYNSHLQFIHKAIRDGVNVKGFFAWSLFDNFEWVSGYTVRFGLNYIDYKDGQKRYPKLSSVWFMKFLQSTKKTEF
ncbi:beta-glucosidase 13-like isoform X2 [Macadamia integrifolia]|uniref:beta-glucosidase 13-like isoform X2 n=1 Tax=Macadamia integrifolia TaxID=60698 RepID=UPI001C52AC0A|nr:beta-glucosidase 13-like isoform X2 [Macadamia integrifolia]